jgi:2-polyprenyl-3-methyl-5-hydroxy-6-metoxy-1,4-benzoquinol methylase
MARREIQLRRGWFDIPGFQRGDRTLAEQMMGVDFEVNGKTVLDLGCAEGLIAMEIKKRGAALVHGVEYNDQILEKAIRLARGQVAFFKHNLNDGLPSACLEQYDVVLLLAILHKLQNPDLALRCCVARARERVIIRLPFGSSGRIIGKHYPYGHCDINETMPDCGFRLERFVDGPRMEMVQHWVR